MAKEVTVYFTEEEMETYKKGMGKRFDQAVKEKQLSYNGIATKVGMYARQLYAFRDGGMIQIDSILKIKSTMPDLNLNWLVCRQGEMFLPEKDEIHQLRKENEQLKNVIGEFIQKVEDISHIKTADKQP